MWECKMCECVSVCVCVFQGGTNNWFPGISVHPCQITYNTEIPELNQLPSFTNFPSLVSFFLVILLFPPFFCFCFPWKLHLVTFWSVFRWWDGSVSMCGLLTNISGLNTRHLDKIGKSCWPFLIASSRNCGEEALALFFIKTLWQILEVGSYYLSSLSSIMIE